MMRALLLERMLRLGKRAQTDVFAPTNGGTVLEGVVCDGFLLLLVCIYIYIYFYVLLYLLFRYIITTTTTS